MSKKKCWFKSCKIYCELKFWLFDGNFLFKKVKSLMKSEYGYTYQYG